MKDRPNVVLVFMDDMGYGDMGAMGGTVVRTPRMDSVAENGITFRHMYSAAPVCTPSRAALMTGRYAQRVGLPRVIFPHEGEGLSGYERTVPEVLKTRGYRTAGYGKWHLGCRPEHNPTRHGFDEFFGLLYSNDMDPVHLYDGEKPVQKEVEQAQLTKQYTDRAIEFIERGGDDPFFVYLAHTMPHIPLHVEEGFRGTSRGGTYGDTIECIDFHLGRILDRLEELGLAEDTLVIVTSDNGPWFEGSTGGLRGRKIDTWEGGIRMPFVARWPARIPAGSVCDEPACFIDLLPTLAGLTGADLPADRPLDGIDIGPALTGGPMPEREALYFFHHWTLNALRQGRWKLHVDRNPQPDRRELPQLFDLEADPGEAYNVANLEPEVMARLTELATSFAAEIAAQRVEAEGRAAGRCA
ncbi:sulfatase [Nonomuraea mesophila]|uniref:Sulfatase n=1 Tax=Nonomuraea mesophila TaxID=2530382 RepID=A0A4V2ZA88_9ACTN|nr:sulfatase [Nonomuraea mesophila]TDE48432.1 sulfatase [Nonomuraea mesophila]